MDWITLAEERVKGGFFEHLYVICFHETREIF